MINKALGDYTAEDMIVLINENVDAVVIVDSTLYKYRALVRRGVFKEFIDESGEYNDLIQKLWFHIEDSSEEITDDYKAFISYYGKFKGKYSRRLKIFLKDDEKPHIIQMNVYPIKDTDKYVFAMDELDDDEYIDEFMTTRKVKTIQNTYLFSMFVDLIRDTTSSISVTEISEDPVNASIKYSQWRLMTVNMIWPEDQKQFLKLTDPEYLKKNLAPGRTIKYDCLMKNLEGVFIWVKLIFSRAKTNNEDDFRFVFMVQDINDDTVELMSTLEKYENLALEDPLTGLFNHGGIKTEILNGIDLAGKGAQQISLMMIDLDNFKNINDTYGHAVGDETLKVFADILKNESNNKNAFAGRWGGEEFVIVLHDSGDDEAFDFAESIRKRVEEAEFNKAGHITCSIGITRIKDDDSFDEAFDRMDKAMYSSKEAGRNKVTKL